MRRPLVMANWKMNGCKADNQQLVTEFLAHWQGVHRAEVVVAPAFVHLAQVSALLANSNVQLAAQDVSAHAEAGAFTGEVSAQMLLESDCSYVIVGHSERRAAHRESSELVAQKVAAVVAAGLKPVLCVGETLAQREAEQALNVVGAMISAVQEAIGPEQLKNLVVAYEPVWAIGTGRTATPSQAQQVHRFIRQQLGELGETVRILYGGSVKAENAAELFSQPDIDGALVGGASLDATAFYRICQAAE